LTVMVKSAIDQISAQIPADFNVYPAYPNPFNPSTTIRYDVPKFTRVLIEVYNTLGQRVCTLLDEEQSAGQRSVVWDGRDDSGCMLPSGVYLYRFRTSEYVKVRKMLLMK